MADPVANPVLIGAKMYEKFVFPSTKALTDYTFQKTGERAALHMWGKTYRSELTWTKYKNGDPPYVREDLAYLELFMPV